MTAEYKVHGNVAVITMANPPVNGLGLSTRQGIVDGLSKANADAAVKSVVITGAGAAFSGGADIKEFGTDRAMQEPNLNSVSWPWAATTAWQRPAAALRCPKSSWASCPALVARSACRACWEWSPR